MHCHNPWVLAGSRAQIFCSAVPDVEAVVLARPFYQAGRAVCSSGFIPVHDSALCCSDATLSNHTLSGVPPSGTVFALSAAVLDADQQKLAPTLLPTLSPAPGRSATPHHKYAEAFAAQACTCSTVSIGWHKACTPLACTPPSNHKVVCLQE